MFADEERALSGRSNERASRIGSPIAGNEEVGLIGEGNAINIHHIGGVIESSEVERLRRMVFRATKGKSYAHSHSFADRSPIARASMSVYIIVF